MRRPLSSESRPESGSDFSSAVGDVQITAQINFQTSAPFHLTTRKPYKLVAGSIVDNCDPNFGYSDLFNYTIQDQLFLSLPANVEYNEHWTTPIVYDYQGSNWGRPNEVGTLTVGPNFADEVTGPGVNNNPPNVPPVACPGVAQQVQHWGQEWRIGSTAIGVGSRVQTDMIVRFTNHAEEQNIVTPAP